MNYLATDKVFLLNILMAIEAKCSMLKSHDLCCVAESIALLKDGMNPEHIEDASKKNGKQSSPETLHRAVVDEMGADDSDKNSGETEATENSGGESSPRSGEATIERNLRQSCDAILRYVGTAATNDATLLQTDEIRRLLAVYSLLPFQDDTLIETISSVVAVRKTHLEKLPWESLGSLLRTARSSAESVKEIAFGNTGTGSVFEQLKHGFMSFFSSMHEREAKESVDEILTEELLMSMQESIDRASMASKSAEDLQIALGVSLDSIFWSMKRGAAFELAQCKELIDTYYRINFVTGTVQSRYDKAGARDVAKRVLSRLLP